MEGTLKETLLCRLSVTHTGSSLQCCFKELYNLITGERTQFLGS